MQARRNASLLFIAALAGCSTGPGQRGPSDNFDRRALLAQIGGGIALPVYQDFAQRAATLAAAVQTYCTALSGPQEGPALDAARQAWRDAMVEWQKAEMMLFGPAAHHGLRDAIYSWPIVSSCAVDQDVMIRHANPSAYDISTRLTNRRGLDALEYILFAPSLAVTCAPQSAPAGWDALSDADKKAARCAYGIDAARDLVQQARTVADAWSPAGGNYLGELTQAGLPGSPFASAHQAVNEVSDALFYCDGQVKDMKLAQPAGIAANRCNVVQQPCPQELESPWASHSKANIASNLEAFAMMFAGIDASGGDGIGFDNFLRELGATDFADQMSLHIAAAKSAVAAIPGALDEALVKNYATVVSAHGAVKAVNDDLKTQFLTVLGLDIPNAAAADND